MFHGDIVYCLWNLVSVVPQQGSLRITTEFGKIQVDPNEICVIQVSVSECLFKHIMKKFFVYLGNITVFVMLQY